MDGIYPKPHQMNMGEEIGFIKNIRFTSLDQHPSFLHPSFFMGNDGEGIEVEVFIGEAPIIGSFTIRNRHLALGDGYYIELRKTGQNQAAVWIAAATSRGYYFSSLTFQQLIHQPLRQGWILDAPSMGRRGIVEGYYGRPWTMEERRRAFSIMASQKMNTYIYAPKNDPYHRESWDLPYPPEEEKRLSHLIASCQDVWLDFVYSVSPGFTIQYSSEKHLQLLISKYAQVYRHNVRHFGLFFDDIPHDLWHEEDKKQFSNLVEAQIHFILSVYGELKELDPENQLMVCPTHYFGKGDESYIVRLGEALPREIELLWTGRTICSPEIDVREARIFYESTGHRPLFWDNYPVNDANMRDEMHIGPFVHRHPKLFLHSAGLISNVMEYAEASLIPMITIAHYLWNPIRYNPQESFSYAIDQVVGKKDSISFAALSDCMNQSSLSPLPGQELMMKWVDFQRKWQNDSSQKEAFHQIIAEYVQHADGLMNMENEKLKVDLKPWILEVKKDLEYLSEVLQNAEDPEELKRITDRKYGQPAKALGFFPLLIADEIKWKKKNDP